MFKIANFQIQPGYPRAISQELPGAPSFVDATFLWRASEQQKYLYIFKVRLALSCPVNVVIRSMDKDKDKDKP